MIRCTSWKSGEVGHKDLLCENRNSTSPSLDLDIDQNQNVLKGSGAKICPGIDSYYLEHKKQVFLTSSSFSHWSLQIFLIDVFVMEPKLLCGFSSIKRKRKLSRPQNREISYFSVSHRILHRAFLGISNHLMMFLGKKNAPKTLNPKPNKTNRLGSLLSEERGVNITGEREWRRLEQLHWSSLFLSSQFQPLLEEESQNVSEKFR